MKTFEPDLVKDLWREACGHYKATYTSKENSDFMSIAGSFLSSLGILDKQKFLDGFTTTIGSVIYVPFEVGVESGNYSLEHQVTTLCHELVHVVQYYKNKARFVTEYLTRRSFRAEMEAEAYAADLELYYWIHGYLYNTERRAQVLSNYALGKKHIKFAADYLESRGKTIVQGGIESEVTAWIIGWLEVHGVK
jgi:hypothetical protein